MRRWPRSRCALRDRPDCSACTDETRSLSPRSASCEGRRSLDLPLSKGTRVGNKPLSSRPSTRIHRLLNGPAPARAPSADQPQRPPPVEYTQLAISPSLCSFVSPKRQSPIRVATISITFVPWATRFRPKPAHLSLGKRCFALFGTEPQFSRISFDRYFADCEIWR